MIEYSAILNPNASGVFCHPERSEGSNGMIGKERYFSRIRREKYDKVTRVL